MLLPDNDLGAALYKTWSDSQRRDEIGRLVEGYRNGLPGGILCKMAETIAGSRTKARKVIREFMSAEERLAAIEKETGGVQIAVRELMK